MNFIKKKGLGYLFNIIVVVIAIVGLILYCISADDKSKMTETTLSPLVVDLFIIGIGMSVTTLFLNSDLTKVLTAVAYVAVLGFWVFSQADFIVNVLIGTDGNSFGVDYIICVICMILAIALTFLTLIKPKKEATE